MLRIGSHAATLLTGSHLHVTSPSSAGGPVKCPGTLVGIDGFSIPLAGQQNHLNLQLAVAATISAWCDLMHQGGFNISSTSAGRAGISGFSGGEKEEIIFEPFYRPRYLLVLIPGTSTVTVPASQERACGRTSGTGQPGIYRLRQFRAGPSSMTCASGIERTSYPKVLQQRIHLFSSVGGSLSRELCKPKFSDNGPWVLKPAWGPACFQEKTCIILTSTVQVVKPSQSSITESTGVMLIFLPGETPL
jgi:hypothetical protein